MIADIMMFCLAIAGVCLTARVIAMAIDFIRDDKDDYEPIR